MDGDDGQTRCVMADRATDGWVDLQSEGMMDRLVVRQMDMSGMMDGLVVQQTDMLMDRCWWGQA